MKSLLSPNEPPVFTHSSGAIPNLFVVADHAGTRVPKSLNNLGCDIDFSSIHFGCDIGVSAVMDELRKQGAETLVTNYSRAVIDPNRMLDHPTLIPAVQDGITLPGNVGLSKDDREARIRELYDPYHEKLDALVDHHIVKNPRTLYFAVHSMEKQLLIDGMGHKTDGKIRPQIALIFSAKEDAMADAFASFFRKAGINDIGMNIPYSGKDENISWPMLQKHQPRLPLMMIEFRNDLLRTKQDIHYYATLLLNGIRYVMENHADTFHTS